MSKARMAITPGVTDPVGAMEAGGEGGIRPTQQAIDRVDASPSFLPPLRASGNLDNRPPGDRWRILRYARATIVLWSARDGSDPDGGLSARSARSPTALEPDGAGHVPPNRRDAARPIALAWPATGGTRAAESPDCMLMIADGMQPFRPPSFGRGLIAFCFPLRALSATSGSSGDFVPIVRLPNAPQLRRPAALRSRGTTAKSARSARSPASSAAPPARWSVAPDGA
jgi:hypothetical protein